MNIKILFDNEARRGLRCGWGFSALIGGTTLFDTGDSDADLLANLEVLNILPEQIDKVVLSHGDWDHSGGIRIIKQVGPVTVYVPASFLPEIRNSIQRLSSQVKLVEIATAREIGDNLIVTSELGESIKEISLLVRTAKGLILLTGCAHPGLAAVMREARQFGDIHAVIGGFHEFGDLHQLAEVPVIVPCHCTRAKHEIARMYPTRTRIGFAGMEIECGEDL